MEKLRINTLIIDDEQIHLDQALRKIALYVEEQRIFTASNSVEVMNILQTTPIDLAFIDVEMADADGFIIAEYIRTTQPKAEYVFLTGHTELGAKSYEYEPLDFLCKPLDALRLQKTFERLKRRRGEKTAVKSQIAVETASGFVLLAPDEIVYVTRENRKTLVCCGGRQYKVKNSLEEVEIMFSDARLFRCHQSYLVSIPKVKEVSQSSYGRTYQAEMTDGSRVPVSRGRYAAMREEIRKQGTYFL